MAARDKQFNALLVASERDGEESLTAQMGAVQLHVNASADFGAPRHSRIVQLVEPGCADRQKE